MACIDRLGNLVAEGDSENRVDVLLPILLCNLLQRVVTESLNPRAVIEHLRKQDSRQRYLGDGLVRSVSRIPSHGRIHSRSSRAVCLYVGNADGKGGPRWNWASFEVDYRLESFTTRPDQLAQAVDELPHDVCETMNLLCVDD
jgi:hypothetical protein